ncbi:MAG: MBL fold metallo-hydrolase [Actinomycetota bacterium]|nr:MBL fold metallo-hydrolase [Actinomycetota bacterium]
MKLKVFYATDGDCLLLTSSDDHHALIDGGRAGSFRTQTFETLRQLAKREEVLDLVVVSHIDADHISGILWLMEVVEKWTVFDFQVTEGGNPGLREPKPDRPPTIKKLWHNSWRAQLEDLAEPIEAFATQVTDVRDAAVLDASSLPPAALDMFDAVQELAQSIPEGVELRRIVDEGTPIPRNKPFKELVLLRDPPHVEKLGKTSLTVIGPGQKHLEALRDEWRAWLADKPAGGQLTPTSQSGDGRAATVVSAALGAGELASALAAEHARAEELATSLVNAAKMIEEADPRKVTPPNRASITLLAEERGRTCLLTGDAAEEEIMEGLEAAGRIVDGRFSCNVLKVQHHGSEFNLSRRFAERVLADHYVFCGDGAHHNPDPSVVKTIVETRLDVDPGPFTLWFNCSPARTAPSKREAMDAAIREAHTAADSHPEVEVKVLDDDEAFFEITV